MRTRPLAVALAALALAAAGRLIASPAAPPDEDGLSDVARAVGGASQLPPARVRFELHRGQRALARGLHASAAESFAVVTEAAPDYPGAWFLLSRALAGDGKPAEALAAARRAVEALAALDAERRAAFDAASFHFNQGLLEIATVDLEAGEASLRRALDLRGDATRVRYQLASLLLQRGRDAEAAAELSRVVDEAPNLAAAWLALGKARLRLDDLPAAEKALETAATLAPDHAETQFVLASVFRARGDLDRQAAALASFERLRERDDRRTTARQAVEVALREASLAMAEGKWAEAAERLGPLEKAPDPAAEGFHRGRILTDLARCRAALGRDDEARALYRAALAEQPRSFLASFELGTLLARDGNVVAALPHLLVATEENPFDYAAHVNLGLAWAGLGRLNDAVGEIRRAVTIQPARDELRQLLVNLEWAVGHEDVARGIASLGGVTLPEGPATPDLQRQPSPVEAGREDLPWVE